MNRLVLLFILSITLILILASIRSPQKTEQSGGDSFLIFPQQQPLCDAGAAYPRPRPARLSELGLLSLEEAKRKIQHFTIKLPANDSLPNGFSLRGVIADAIGSSEYKGVIYKHEIVLLVYWDGQINPQVNFDEFGEAGGIIVTELFKPGGVESYSQKDSREEWSDVGWYRTAKFAEIYNYRQNVTYWVRGCNYQEQSLVSITMSLKGRTTPELISTPTQTSNTFAYAVIGIIVAVLVAAVFLKIRQLPKRSHMNSNRNLFKSQDSMKHYCVGNCVIASLFHRTFNRMNNFQTS